MKRPHDQIQRLVGRRVRQALAAWGLACPLSLGMMSVSGARKLHCPCRKLLHSASPAFPTGQGWTWRSIGLTGLGLLPRTVGDVVDHGARSRHGRRRRRRGHRLPCNVHIPDPEALSGICRQTLPVCTSWSLLVVGWRWWRLRWPAATITIMLALAPGKRVRLGQGPEKLLR
jgi:hypothetical protein